MLESKLKLENLSWVIMKCSVVIFLQAQVLGELIGGRVAIDLWILAPGSLPRRTSRKSITISCDHVTVWLVCLSARII